MENIMNTLNTLTDSEIQAIKEASARYEVYKLHIKNKTLNNENIIQSEICFDKCIKMIGEKLEINAIKSCQEFIAESENNIYIDKIEK
jgi:hypothetical protein